jgi:amidase
MTIARLLLPFALAASSAAVATPQTWVVAVDHWGNPIYRTLMLDSDGANLSGRYEEDPVTGSRHGRTLRFTVTGASGERLFTGRLDGERITGMAEMADPNDDRTKVTHAFTARRVAAQPPAPRTIDFEPSSWSNSFDANRPPVLTLWPGDIVRTRTLDSGGIDRDGTTRALYGNPQVGPFHIGGAEPGDTLVVHIRKLRLNRDFADSRDEIVPRATSLRLAPEAATIGRRLRWRLDPGRGLAFPPDAAGAFAGRSFAVRPMLGGIAVAPGTATPISTGDTGIFGGNIDFNEIREGNSVYLPVQQPGALLYFGDGHALQGDGETTQWALETSLDVEIQVDLVKGQAIRMPYVTSPTELMVVGQAPSLDEAVKLATDGLVQLLRRDHGLTLSQSAQLLGVAARYSIVTLAGRNAGIAARIDRSAIP